MVPKAFVLAIVVASLGLAVPVSAQSVIYACVLQKLGTVRIVAANQACSQYETKVQWNVVGSQGPVGPVGPTGSTGAAGPIGPSGVAGPQGVPGIQGSPGMIAAFMCPSFQYVAGIDANGQGVCRTWGVQPDTLHLDQSYIDNLVSHGTVQGADQFAQTFTVGRTGFLTSVDLAIGRENNPPPIGDLVISILEISPQGLPASGDGAELSTVVIPASFWPFRDSGPDATAYRNVEFAPVLVAAGQKLAISVRRLSVDASSDVFYWYGNGQYPAGQAYGRSGAGVTWTAMADFDFTFRTYVSPTP